ncbi:MAG: hypothetical protein ACOZCL_02580 [Bacillota bacterium]
MEDAVKRMRKLRQKRKQQGVCVRCGRAKDDSYSTCMKCRSEFRKSSKAVQNTIHKPVRTLRKWRITNQKLFELLNTASITVSDFADSIGVSIRTAERWIFEEVEPNTTNKDRINRLFNKEIYELEK